MSNITYVILACYPDRGMKSYGSKGLMIFNKKKLFEYQISAIQKLNKTDDYEIIIICNFDYQKIIKAVGNKVNVIQLDSEKNPIHQACCASKNSRILFLDYGLIFNKKALSDIELSDQSEILCTNAKNNNLEVGCVIGQYGIEHLFLGLDSHKFCNLFYICDNDYEKIIANNSYHAYNLLYFEIINQLISTGSRVTARHTNNKNFFYFNSMRQKNGINKFIKTNC